ncbi:unnamed protein product [Bursaphelenchus xylophilus]|uniref:(pine wood nematode) hypothetical protein n=1 Tax=Bursaphelenchus xylophilus TaxID=6326 RepID=A0A1I7S4M4_BURXY|nr:unnamed protein product [Bursaphelenchus xylophilus]CAG9117237.1 unnamed protein product [Bursaphelenchus xylophilus]
MNRYWFEPEAYGRLYNCSRFTSEEWHGFGIPDKVIGATYVSIGLMYEVLYFPCLYTMSGKRFLRLSCYKIMFYLGLIDVACIFINSIIDGFFAWHGNVFCDYPDLMYISGAISTGLWCSACMACMMLAMNRVCDLIKPEWMEVLFGGSRTYFWLLAPTAYGLYFIIFTPPLIFSSIYDGAFFDPFVGTPTTDKEIYTSWPHTINNMVVIAVLVTAYSCVCVVVLMKSRLLNSGTNASRNTMSGMQRTIVAQATMICMLILVAATVYVRMQFFETAGYMVVVGQITWQSSHGGAVFIYLFLNKTMRNEIRREFCCTKSHQISSTTNQKHRTHTTSNMSSNRDSHGEMMY